MAATPASAGSATQASSSMSAAPTPDFVRSHFAQGDSDDESISVQKTPSDSTQQGTHCTEQDEATFSFLASLLDATKDMSNLDPSIIADVQAGGQTEEEEAHRIHDIDMLFGDGDYAASSDVEHSCGSQGESMTFATQPNFTLPLFSSGLILPQGDGRLRSQTPSCSSQAASVSQSDLPSSQGAVIGHTLGAHANVNTTKPLSSSASLPSSDLPSQTVPAAPAPRRRGRPRKYPLLTDEHGKVIKQPKPKAPSKRKAQDDAAPRKKLTAKDTKGKAAASDIPLSIPDLGRLIPQGSTPESTQAFIQTNIKLFADLFLALQKQATDDRKVREEAREELRGIVRSRSVDAISAAAIDKKHDLAGGRCQSVPAPAFPLGTSSGPGLFARSEPSSGFCTPRGSLEGASRDEKYDPLWAALQEATSTIAKGRFQTATSAAEATSHASLMASSPSSSAMTSIKGQVSTEDFTLTLSHALTQTSDPNSDSDASLAASPAPLPNRRQSATPHISSTPMALHRRKSEPLSNEVKTRLVEVVSGHDSLRDEMIRLKVDMQYYENAHKTVDERISVLRARIASRSEYLRKERDAKRPKKDRKGAEKILREAENLEKSLEAQANMIEEEIQRQHQQPPEAASSLIAGASTSMSDNELAQMLSISFDDLMAYNQPRPTVPEQQTTFDLGAFLDIGLNPLPQDPA